MEYFTFDGIRKYKRLYASRKRYLMEYIHCYVECHDFDEYDIFSETNDYVRLESHNSSGPVMVTVKDSDDKISALQFFINGRLEGSQLFYTFVNNRLFLKRKEYYSDGVLHRIGGPAVIIYDVTVNEFLHHSQGDTLRTFFTDTLDIREYWLYGNRIEFYDG